MRSAREIHHGRVLCIGSGPLDHLAPLASHRVAGADAQHARDEFPERNAPGDDTTLQVEGGLGLWNAASSNIGNTVASSTPVTTLTSDGIRKSRRGDGACGQVRWLTRSIDRLNSTAARPASTPTTIDSAEKELSFTEAEPLGSRGDMATLVSCLRPMRRSAWSSGILSATTVRPPARSQGITSTTDSATSRELREAAECTTGSNLRALPHARRPALQQFPPVRGFADGSHRAWRWPAYAVTSRCSRLTGAQAARQTDSPENTRSRIHSAERPGSRAAPARGTGERSQ